MKKLFEKVFGTHSDKEIKRIIPLVDKIEALEPEMEKLTDDQLKSKTNEFRERLKKGETLDDILIEAYAVVREAGKRTVGIRAFRVKALAAIILHQGRIAEMKTGEGKTYVAPFVVYLNALEGKGVHIVTVNDYLAKRDAENIGLLYHFLGLTVGVIVNGIDNEERREAYNCDITYGTNNEFGFDYLRDNMVIYKKEMVQRELNFVVIDEVDSVLIDEARTPLIISGSSSKSTHLYQQADIIARRLQKGRVIGEVSKMSALLNEEIQEEGDFVVDEKAKSVSLTADGIKKVEQFFQVDNLADPENMEIQHHVILALKAHNTMFKDKDYVIKEEEIIIVDEFTGRLMPGRRYSNGLHQAIEAKESVRVRRESKTLATITFQNYFNKYDKKSGMTGTALTEEEEFREIYGMDVIAIPTNKPVIRKDQPDQVYKSHREKVNAVIDDIAECYDRGQPVLVGTITIESSEELSKMLRKKGVVHKVLNAKYHEREADIVAMAGQKGAVTIATNMAGRGTDIKLGEGVIETGGLKIIGTERHESRRIDNQLRGRSGRQGDPGESKFYISLDDDLMRLFGSERMKNTVTRLGLPEGEPIAAGILSNAIENAQKKVEGNNFSIRKHLLDYDQVMNEQREIIYGERKKVLEGDNMRDFIMSIINEVIGRFVDIHAGEEQEFDEWDIPGLMESLNEIIPIRSIHTTEEERESLTKDKFKEKIYEIAAKLYEDKEHEFDEEEFMREAERVILLKAIDQKWMDHIDNMDQMRQGIGLRAYGQRDPLVEYKFLGFDMFEEMSNNIQEATLRALYRIRPARKIERERVAKVTSTNRGEQQGAKQPVRRKERKVGRNELCPCGSGKKYKYCCGRNQ
ncbi:preprotein translocase subunit SecA [Vallitalea sp.]|jgi:preprotein translocase subunit SecA|uniref:preprotein translocase subunit SecA n=1 Tax=Vallitalea sp. TaxID=1882829 RepID=UPI0025F113FB|nr:preprotein translocase subunit SecA [Vallitalea sp.]MCT4688628.1 preprotein translocase subunit SecA [Vallitalea sp.]